jgi:outer membrane immunogenic protein
MKRLLIACVAATALAGPARSADLPSRKYAPVATPAPYVPAFVWTGFYVGGNLGYNWGAGNGNTIGYYSPTPARQADLAQVVASGWLPTRLGGSQSGFTAGLQGGYNFQLNSSFVIGVEGDINWVGGGKPTGGWYVTTATTAGNWGGYGSASTGMNWLGTARARLGFAIDHFLFYGTGGFAFGNTQSSFGAAVTDYRNGTLNYGWYGSKSDTAVGWTIGGGAEFAFTTNWTAKIEYLYYDLGDQTYTVASPQLTDVFATVKHQQSGSILRTGVNYKF